MMANEGDKCASVEVRREAAGLFLVLRGDWLLRHERPDFQLLEDMLAAEHGVSALRFDVSQLGEWDTALLLYVRRCGVLAMSNGLDWDAGLSDLPENARNMIELSVAVPRQLPVLESEESGVVTAMGTTALSIYRGLERYCSFIGELLIDFGAFITGRAQLRRKDFLYLLQASGPQALGIVCLLSFLTGLIIAFIGVIQLQKFGADIYVADLVGVAMTRELGAVMAGVIMAGRTGAAFAAQIGSMQVNEEVDALTCFGISPMQFLVLPRVLALVLMMPLLCVSADLVAILGGMVVAVSISDVSVIQYFNQVEQAVSLNDLCGGIFKSAVFGVIIALSGCYRGLHCGKDAASVGLATTSAVVTAITWMVVADAVFAVTFHILGI
jgi:phospholipid/cholesterol/gamma-HCH transport system permease protein